MRKISGQLLSSKPISLHLAAKRLTRFASVENGASASVSIYLQHTVEAFNNLVQLHEHNKPFKLKKENQDDQIDDNKKRKKKNKKSKSDDGGLNVEVKKEKLDIESEEKVSKQVKTEKISVDEAKVEKKKKKKKTSNDVGFKVQVKKERD